jgi:hypothetical protein
MNVNHLYFLFEENMMKSLNRNRTEKFEDRFVKTPHPLYFLFYFFEIPQIFPYKTPDIGIR